MPGYPQDQSPEGLASPLKGYAAAADAVVKSGTHGLLYYGGLVFNRGGNVPSAIFLARYVDRNNKENGDPFAYLGTSIVDSNSGAQFLDKPAFAVGLPRPGVSGTCTLDGQSIATGPVYAAWTIFLSEKHPHSGKHDSDDDGVDDKHPKKAEPTIRSRIMFSRSLDCGETWSKPHILSATRTNQAAAIAIDPRNGDVYLAWRQFASGLRPHAIVVTRSTNGGRSWGPRTEIGHFFPFDQGTSNTSFRTNSYPTIAIDQDGRLHVAWAARGFAPMAPDPETGDARIALSTSVDGRTWSLPRAIDNWTGRGHQIMPAMVFAAGRLQLVYYDLREDLSGFFEEFVDEFNILRLPPGTPGKRRHTLDVRTAQAVAGPAPEFTSYAVTPSQESERASQYLIGSRPGSGTIEQLQFSPPNLPLFASGSVPFVGDYIDVAARTIVPEGSGWRYSNASDAAVFHLVWADNRDVRPPADGNWSNYTPPTFSGSGGASIFDPKATVGVCVPGQAGMRNQNVYTSRITPGLFVGSPGNAKPLSTNLQRSFVVFAQNTTNELGLYRFAIAHQPPGGYASFLQVDGAPATPQFDVLTQMEVLVPGGSSAARSVFVTSTDPHAQVRVDVVQIAGGGSVPPPEGRADTVILNPDILNPDILNPDILNPDILNPDILNAEVHNPDILNPDILNLTVSNPDILNPDILNPDILNVEVANPDILNPDILNPDILNPDILNPDILNPDILNPDILNGSITDYSYTVTNSGNTASQYELTLEETDPVPDLVKLQLVIHRTYQTPVVDQCTLKLRTQNQVLLNLPRPTEFPGLITFWLEPGESIKITFRVVDTNRNDGITWDPTQSLVVTVTAGAVNWDAEAGPDPGGAASDSATPPVALDDEFEVDGGGTLDVPAPGVRGNDTVVGEQVAEVILMNAPAHAANFTLRADGSFVYVPEEGFTGTDMFTYRLRIGPLRSRTATVTIEVTGNPLVVTNTNDSGFGSLRHAIDFANEHANLPYEVDTITFNIPGEGSRRIKPRTLLPVVSDPVMIDATTQPGYYGTPAVIIDGSMTDTGEMDGGWGLVITAGHSVVRGLAFVNTPGKGLVLSEGGSNVVQSNWIGVDPASGYAAPTYEAGIAIVNGSSGNTIGLDCHASVSANDSFIGPNFSSGDEPGCLAAGANLISGNAGAGIAIYGGSANAIRGNLIGTTPNGLAALPNGEGITVAGGSHHQIGGALPGEGNVISGNLNGVVLQGAATSNRIEGNLIGLAPNGTTAVPNRNGVVVEGAANTIVGNVISGNRSSGIRVAAPGAGNTIAGNYVGVDASGMKPLPNQGHGVHIIDSPNNTIGGPGSGHRNVISSNVGEGVRIDGAPSTGNRIQGNYVGLSAGGADFGNSASGIYIRRAPANVVEDNVVSGNDGFAGIAICGTVAFCGGGNVGTQGSTAGGNVVRRNWVGLDGTGTAARGNTGHGISIDGAPNTAVGGVEQGNVIANSGASGIVIFGSTATGNTVQGNLIGLDAPGVVAMGNEYGVVINASASNNLVGGGGAEGNVIAHSAGIGVFVEGSNTVGNRVLGNSLFGSGQLNLDLAPIGVTPNDPRDADVGANYLQNFPEMTEATVLGYGTSRVSGTMNTLAGATVRVEIFRNPGGCTYRPQARQFIAARTFVTDYAGNGSFVASLQGGVIVNGDGITTTATTTAPGFGSNTSEISTCVVAREPIDE